MNVHAAFAAIDMPPSRFIGRYVSPGVAVSLVAAVVLRFAMPDVFGGPLSWALPLLPVLVAAALLAYPFVRAQEKRQQVDRNVHFFVTHLGVLATSSIPRADIFRILSEKQEYGAIAREAKRIHLLVAQWNMSLADAARFVSKRTPSRIFSDFLARLAHALDSGEDLPFFLTTEQSTVMQEYEHAYRRTLYKTEVYKSLYNSVVMSLAFLFIFGMLMPALTGISPTLVLGGALIIVFLLEYSLVHLSKSRAPQDPVWGGKPGWGRVADPRLLPTLSASIVGCLLVAALASYLDAPLPIAVAATFTPLAFVGMKAGRLETNIQRREENYGAFIRSLGASASAHGGQVRPVLKQLQYHDFGPLREDVVRLYRRLQIRANDAKAWDAFGTESDSHLMVFFNRMFEEGLSSGGKPETISTLMSENFARLVALRKERYQTATNFRGLAFGLTLALAGALAVGVGTVQVLAGALGDFDMPEGAAPGSLATFQGLDFGFVDVIVMTALVTHALAAAVVVGILRGSHPLRATLDFVMFTWGVALVLIVTSAAFPTGV